VTDDVSKLGYISVIFLDLEAKVDGTYYCDLLLSQQTVPEYIGYAIFSDINISQGSVATTLRCGGICNDRFIDLFMTLTYDLLILQVLSAWQ